MYMAITPYRTDDFEKEVKEIYRFLTSGGFTDCGGFQGDVCDEGEWNSLWAFETDAEAQRFVREWAAVEFA
jgi:hypothetical protein